MATEGKALEVVEDELVSIDLHHLALPHGVAPLGTTLLSTVLRHCRPHTSAKPGQAALTPWPALLGRFALSVPTFLRIPYRYAAQYSVHVLYV